LPTELGLLAELRLLYLHENELVGWLVGWLAAFSEIGRLAQLKELYLHENELVSWFAAFRDRSLDGFGNPWFLWK
jgi:hypothetical protein